MKITPLKIAGAAVIYAEPIGDERGAFARWFCKDELASLLDGREIVNVNYSRTEAVGTIRGMHVQRKPALEMKLVRCTRGAVHDVIVDLRTGSPTFMQWHALRLDPQAMNMLVVPEGVAHGFQVLEPSSEMLYLHTAAYDAKHEAAVRYDDPALSIDWPIDATVVSERDQSHPLIDASFKGVEA